MPLIGLLISLAVQILFFAMPQWPTFAIAGFLFCGLLNIPQQARVVRQIQLVQEPSEDGPSYIFLLMVSTPESMDERRFARSTLSQTTRWLR